MARGAAFLRKLGRLGLGLAVVLFAALAVVSSINFHAVPGIPGSSGVPDVPKVNQSTMDKATASTIGQKLKAEHYTAKSVLDDPDMVSWLDENETSQKLSNPGPYVLFSGTTVQASTPSPNVPSDALVDANNSVISALYQAFSNGRGLLCYNAHDIRLLSTAWVSINTYLWHRNLAEHRVTVSNKEVPQVPASLGTVSCYLFIP